MAKKRFSVKLDEEIYNEVKEIAGQMEFTTAKMLAVLLRQGIVSVGENGFKLPKNTHKKHEIDAEKLLNLGKNTAEKGLDALNTWLATLTPQEENAIKYNIKPLRLAAVARDDKVELAKIPDIVREHDSLCLKGRGVWLPAWEALSKNVQDAIKHKHYKRWWFESGRSDSMAKLFGENQRPTEPGWQKHLEQNGMAGGGKTVAQKAEDDFVMQMEKAHNELQDIENFKKGE